MSQQNNNETNPELTKELKEELKKELKEELKQEIVTEVNSSSITKRSKDKFRKALYLLLAMVVGAAIGFFAGHEENDGEHHEKYGEQHKEHYRGEEHYSSEKINNGEGVKGDNMDIAK